MKVINRAKEKAATGYFAVAAGDSDSNSAADFSFARLHLRVA
jgi:hypothetical protein